MKKIRRVVSATTSLQDIKVLRGDMESRYGGRSRLVVVEDFLGNRSKEIVVEIEEKS